MAHVSEHTTSDGCTWWPDGIPSWLGGAGDEWVHCCVAHDLGGTDWELGECVAEVWPFMGVLMFFGIVTFGLIYRRRTELRKRETQ